MLTLTAGIYRLVATTSVRLLGIPLSIMVNVLVLVMVWVLVWTWLLLLLWFRIPQLLNMPIDRGANLIRVTIGMLCVIRKVTAGVTHVLFLSPMVLVLALCRTWVVVLNVRLGLSLQVLKGRLIMISVWLDLCTIVRLRRITTLSAIFSAEGSLRSITFMSLLIRTMLYRALVNCVMGAAQVAR